jgi:hypothetical protein
MSVTGLAAFDSTVQTTNIWLHELMDEMAGRIATPPIMP